MKVKSIRTIKQYHLFFDREETSFLRDVGFFHPMCKEETDMWMSQEDINALEVYGFDKTVLDKIVRNAEEHYIIIPSN